MAFNKNKVMDAARKFVERGQVDRAIKEYLRVVQEDPKDVRVWLKVGDLYAKKGAKQEATETYLKVAKFYSEQGFYLKAVAVYKQILKLDARLVEVNLKLAELYRQLGLMSDAMQHFEMVAAHFHREGKTKEALATVRQLVNLDPENVATRIKLAELYSKEGMVEEAVTEFGAACDYLRAHNRQDDFIKVAERLLWHKPEAHELNRELATLYLRRNDPRRALQKLQACFKADARDVETLALLAQAFQALDQKGKTVSVLKELARVLDEDGKKEQAADVHRKILMYVPDEADSRAYLGEAEPVAAAAAPPSPTHDRLAITSSDLPSPAPRKLGKATGSMPLVKADDERPFSDPELIIEGEDDDEDFAADFAMEESSPRFDTGSVQGEMHAEEIIKILTETDVYVKYGLHQKAIDHLKRVFELDPENVEARERLKEIYVSQGREADAIDELLRLAEMAAPTDADRAEQYLREILAMDGTCEPALELARRHRLDIGGGPDVEIIEDYSDAIELDADSLNGGAVAAVDDDDMEFEMDFGDSGEVVANDIPSLDDEDDGFEFAALAEESEAEYEFDIDDSMIVETPLAPDGSVVTQEVSLDQVEGIVALEEEVDDLGFESDLAAEPIGAVAAAISDPSLPVTEDPLVPPTVAPIGFDPDDAAAFDADIDAAEAHALSAEPMADVGGLVSDFGVEPEPEPELPYRDEAGTALSPPQFLTEEPSAPEATVDSGMDTSEGTHGDQSGGTGLEDDLDEADFFVSQGLYGEARDILHTLLGRYPGHPLVTAKLQDVEAMHAAAGGVGETPPPETLGDMPAPTLDAGPDLLQEVDEESVVESRPAVLLERPVADEDADTHYDLGLAYKEMGLYGEAIKAFEKVVQHESRMAQSYLMIGMCHREQGNLSEAVHQFKQGLHAPSITDREKQSTYYEIGATYEAIGDAGEAVYYYEMVAKKDPSYRDVEDRVASIKGAMGRNGDARRGGPAPEDTDAAIESLLADSDSRSGRH